METSQFKWVDTHCHLYSKEFDGDRGEMIERAITSGIEKMMMPNIDLESTAGMLDLADKYADKCFPMMGLHPCSVKEDFSIILDKMEEEFSSRQYIGIGETGIDLFWDTTFKVEQIIAFERHIEWAKSLDLPIIIHSRESLDLTIELISKYQDGRLKGIFHCFSGNSEQIDQINKLGFKVGIGGVVTYKKAGLAEMLPQIPLKMIVLETDSPYLAPVPSRGKRNEPSLLLHVAAKIAEVLDMPLFELSRITSENAEAVYGKKD
jgi:TatD DNase family protein